MIKKGFDFKYISKESVGFKICIGNSILNCKSITKLNLF